MKRQRRTISVYAVAVAFAAVFVLLQVQEVRADDLQAAGTCWNGSLKGSYGHYRTGFTPDGPTATVGISKFDGTGNFTVKQTTSRNGEFQPSKFSGRIQVAADCTFKAFNENGDLLGNGVIVDNANGFFLLNRTPGNSIIFAARKIQTQ